MVMPNYNILRKQIIVKFSKEWYAHHKTGVFPFASLYDYMNSYKTKKGKIHKRAGASKQQLGTLLAQSPLFNRIDHGIWEYVGEA